MLENFIFKCYNKLSMVEVYFAAPFFFGVSSTYVYIYISFQKSFLLQLGGMTLKTTIKCIIRELYSLDLQQKLNYSGRENKFSTKNLIQTKLILGE